MARERTNLVEREALAARRAHGLEPDRSLGGPLPVQARLLLPLQQSAGNRAVSGLVQRRRQGVGDAGVVKEALPPGRRYANLTRDLLQRWPSPEVSDEPKPTLFGTYKCHDAVVYWVLRSLPLKKKRAREALNLMQRKRGPSAGWIVEALNYGSGTRVSSPHDVNVGDILFTGATSYVAHTMVVIDAKTIKGYNNFGTFGTAKGGDKYSKERFAKPGYWHKSDDGQQQIGVGKDASFPIYKVSIGTAQAALNAFIASLASAPDYVLPRVGETTEQEKEK